MMYLTDSFYRFLQRNLSVFVFILTSFLLVSNASDNSPSTSDYVLPSFLVPQNYFVRLRPIFEETDQKSNASEVGTEAVADYVGLKDTAPGFVRIRVSCINSTKTVILHSKNVEINESSVRVQKALSPSLNESVDSMSTDFEVMSVSYDGDKDFVIFNVTRELEAGHDYEISMDFIAQMPQNDSLAGLYSVYYHLDWLTNPETRAMAITKFEPIGARQVFPCMDEPIYKATFDVMISRRENFSSLSNGPLINTEPDGAHPGWFWDRFETTVKLPSYLLAFAVMSDFGFVEASNDLYRLPVRVYGPREWIELGHAQLIANYSAQLLGHYENKYGIPFSMPKLDSLWVPGKKAAMECHGLILYGDQMLVVKEDGSADLGEIRFNWNVLSHEIAHAWFGNAVGNSWTEVWLKEGMSTYVSYDGMSAVWPDMQGMTYMIYEVIGTAFEYDAKQESHPLKQEAHTNLEIKNNMDILGYDKGAALVRMMVGFLGETGFYEGIRQYLSSHKEQVATQEDLFTHLNAAVGGIEGLTGENLSEIMTPWTTQPGFPLVRVRWQGNSSLLLSQEPWENAATRETTLNQTTNKERAWDIPIRYVVIREFGGVVEDNLVWLRRNESNLKINIDGINKDNEWVVLVNSDGTGYYRVMYDEEMAFRVVNQLQKNHSVFSSEARAMLLDEQFSLALQKYIPIQAALEYTKYMTNERDPTVWNCGLHLMLKVFMLFRPTINGLQSRNDFIALKEKLQMKMYETLSDGGSESNNSSHYPDVSDDPLNNATTLNWNDTSRFIAVTQIIDHEIAHLRKSNGLDENAFRLFSAYVLPRINSTLLGITSSDLSHSPGSNNFSLSAVGILESVLIDWSCSLHSEWCLHYSYSLVTEWAFGGKNKSTEEGSLVKNPIPTDIQALLYCQMVDWFGDFAYDWIYSQYQATNDTTQEMWLTLALSCSQENNSFSEVVSMLTEGHRNINGRQRIIKRQYTSSVFSKLMQHSEYGTIFMGLFLSLVPLSDYPSYFNFEDGSIAISGLFEYPQNYFWTGAHLQMVEDIVASNPEFYGDVFNSTIEIILNNMRWMAEFRENITLWLAINT